ncbi:MAG: glycosyltransferase family protein [Planctomycetota bacterium]
MDPSQSTLGIEPEPADCISVRDWCLALSVAVVGALVLMPRVFWGLPFGKSICGGLRVLEGHVPYRDFWTMYAPGQFYAIAGLFRIFGQESLVQGIAVILINGASGGVMFLIARRAGIRRQVAALISFVIIVSLWIYSTELTTYPPALLCALFAIERVLCYLHRGGLGKLVFAGLLLGVAACFKHDVAFYITTATVVMLFASWFGIARRRPAAWSHPARAAFALVGGAVVIVVPAIILLALYAGKYAWQDLVVWPATDFRGVRAEGMPTLPDLGALKRYIGNWSDLRSARDAVFGQSHYILCNMPVYVFIIATGCLFSVWRRIPATKLAASLLLLAMLPMFWIIAHIQPNTHLYSMAIASLCLIGMAWPKAKAADRRQNRLKIALGIVIAFYTLGLIAFPATSIARIAMDWSGRQYLGLSGARGKWVPKYQYDVYYPIVNFIRRHVPADERIYVGLKRHDAPVINDLKFYYLTGRKNCCRYDELHPGITDRADVQQEIIDAIERHRVRCVVIWRFGWSDAVLDEIKAHNMAAIAGLGNTHLDTYIAETFEVLGQYGEYDLMWRKGAARPKVEEQISAQRS